MTRQFGYASLVMARIEKRSVSDYGLSLRRVAGKQFLWGVFWGLCMFLAVMVVIAALHGFSFGGLALRGLAIVKYASLWAIGFLLVGFVEEFLYRGYVQFTLAQAIGFWPAAIVWSLVLGAMHMTNPGENLAGALEVFLFAMFACLTLRRTGGGITGHQCGISLQSRALSSSTHAPASQRTTFRWG